MSKKSGCHSTGPSLYKVYHCPQNHWGEGSYAYLLPSLLPSQRVLLSGCYQADGDVVHSALVKHHQRVRLLCVLPGAPPHHEGPVLEERMLKVKANRAALDKHCFTKQGRPHFIQAAQGVVGGLAVASVGIPRFLVDVCVLGRSEALT